MVKIIGIVIISLVFLCLIILTRLGILPLKRWHYEQRAHKLGEETRERIQSYSTSRYTTSKAQNEHNTGWKIVAIVLLTLAVFSIIAIVLFPDKPKPSTNDYQMSESAIEDAEDAIQSNFVDFSIPDSGYIINGSDERLIGESELFSLSENACWIALDEIYARHGRIFSVTEIKEYFEAMPWYHGTIDGASFDQEIDKYLSSIEIKNIDIIVKYMRNNGWHQ